MLEDGGQGSGRKPQEAETEIPEKAEKCLEKREDLC